MIQKYEKGENVKIEIQNINIGTLEAGQTLESIIYEVSSTSDMSAPLVPAIESTNLKSIEIDIPDGKSFYTRITPKIRTSTGVIKTLKPSIPAFNDINSNDYISSNNKIIQTPKVWTDANSENILNETIIYFDHFDMFLGADKHKKTEITVYDIDRNIVFQDLYVPTDKLSFTLEKRLTSEYSILIIEVVMVGHSCRSFPGSLVVSKLENGLRVDEDFKLKPSIPFTLDILEQPEGYDKLSVSIIDSAGNSIYINSEVIGEIRLNNIKINERYTFTVTMTDRNGNKSKPYIFVKASKENVLYPVESSKYSLKPRQTHIGSIDTKGQIVVSSQLLDDNKTFLFFENSSTGIYVKTYIKEKISSVKKLSITLPDLPEVPHMVVRQVSNESIVIIYTNSDDGLSAMILDKKFNFLSYRKLTATSGATYTGSVTEYKENVLIFPVGADIYTFDVITNVLTKLCTIPDATILRYVNVVPLNKDEVMVFSGSKKTSKVRSNLKVWTYRISTDSFTETTTIPKTSIDTVINVLSSYRRRDGKVVIFNNSLTDNTYGKQNTYLYDPITKTVVNESNDFLTNDTDAYRSSVLMSDGSFLRITERMSDTQKIYRYTLKDDTMTGTDTDTISFNIVIVPDNETEYIESTVKIDSITLGTNSNIIVKDGGE